MIQRILYSGKLPLYPSIKPLNAEDFKFNSSVVSGNAVFFPVYKDNDISIARCFGAKGTEYARHCHADLKEFIIVVSGKLKIIYDDREEVYEASDFCEVPANVFHQGEFLESSWVVVITIPPESRWPDDVRKL